MCAEFMIRASNQKITRALGIAPGPDEFDWDVHARLYSEAPVIVQEKGETQLRPMGFSLKPRDIPYPTFNARLLSWDEKKKKIVPITEKPTWKGPLKQQRCLIPMSAFIEPVYKGDHAGEMVMFKDEGDEMLFCAGLYDESVNHKTGEVYEGFTLIIHTPSEFVLNTGHHRQPIFLAPDDARTWLDWKEIKPEDTVDFLLDKRLLPDLKIEKSRSMAKGWEKRVSEFERKLEKEMQFMNKLEAR